MSLRRKTFFVLGGALLLLLVLAAGVTWRMAVVEGKAAENARMDAAMRCVRERLAGEIEGLEASTQAWAARTGPDPSAQATDLVTMLRNVTPDALGAMRLHCLALVDRDGQVVVGRWLDPQTQQELPWPAALSEQLLSRQTIDPGNNEAASGVWLALGEPFLVAIRPVPLPSASGPVQGTLVVGRALEAGLLAQLGQGMGVTVEVERAGPAALSEARRLAAMPEQEGGQSTTSRLGNQLIAAYTLPDLLGQPALLLRVAGRRNLTGDYGRLAVFPLSMLLIGLAATGAVCAWLMERGVHERLGRLRMELARVAEAGVGTERINLGGKDEVAEIAADTNHVLGVLRRTQISLRVSEERCRRLNAGLEERVARRTAELQHRVAIEAALAEMSTALAAADDVDLNGMLALLGRAVDADRAYLVRFGDDGQTGDNTHEWCAAGVEPQMAKLQRVPSSALPYSTKRLLAGEAIVVADIDALPEEAAAEQSFLRARHIRALVTVPMFSLGKPYGFLGFDDVRHPRDWLEDDVRLLRTAAEVLMAYVERQRASDALRFLVQASPLLAASLDTHTTLQNAARLALPILGEACAAILAGEPAMPRQVAVAHVRHEDEERLQEACRRYPQGMNVPASYLESLQAGQPVHIAHVSEAHLAMVARDEEHLHLLRGLGIRHCLFVPLQVRGALIGYMIYGTQNDRRSYDRVDILLARDLARRVAIAVDNARLYHEAQQAIRVRDEFLSVAAHELKTPMTSLHGFAELTLRRLDRKGTLPREDIAPALQTIEQQSSRLTQLVAQLLDVSRIENGQLEIAKSETDLSSLVGDVVVAMQSTTDRHELRLQAPPALPALVDALRVEQVVGNLLSNAIRYSPQGGDIEVGLEKAPAGAVRLTVRDHGLGVPPERRAGLFTRYYSAHDSRHGGGLGLGLFISRHIVEQHGGRIHAEFPEDGGTRFVVELPRGNS